MRASLADFMQIAAVVIVCALLGGKIPNPSLSSSDVSIGGALVGGAFPLIAFSILAVFRKGKKVDVVGSPTNTTILKMATLALFVATIAVVGLLYTHAVWLKIIVGASVVVGALAVFVGVVRANIFPRKDNS
jgi:hypothetical protein